MGFYDVPLIAALDAAAVDTDTWQAGHAKFIYELMLGSGWRAALDEALDEAAADAPSWVAGEAAFKDAALDMLVAAGDDILGAAGTFRWFQRRRAPRRH